MTENCELRQSRKAATVADLQGVDGKPFLFYRTNKLNLFKSAMFFFTLVHRYHHESILG